MHRIIIWAVHPRVTMPLLRYIFRKVQLLYLGQGQFFYADTYIISRKSLNILSVWSDKDNMVSHFYICTSIEKYQYRCIQSFGG